MKSIQSRLLVTLLVSFVVLWSLMSVWLLLDLQHQLKQTLDQRLAASARMVAGLVAQLPAQHLSEQYPSTQHTPTSNLAQREKLLARTDWPEGVACQVRQRNGELLLQTNTDMEPLFADTPPGFSEREVEDTRWRLFTYVQDDIVITTADRIQEREALYRGVLTAVAGPVLIALIGMLYATWWGIRRGLKPLHRLRETLQRRQAEDLTPIELAMPYELAPLQQSLNQLLSRVSQLLTREKRFTSDAAHELRTPLTSIKANVQLAQRLEPAEAKAVLSTAESGISRMQRIVEQLMLLSRLDAGFTEQPAKPTEMGAIIAEALSDVEDLERVQVQGETRLRVSVDPTLLAMALRNIIDNALAYSSADVTVMLQRQSDLLVLSVSDKGPGLTADEKALAFNRFWRSGQGQGSGLGLSITKQICEQLGVTLELDDAAPGLEVNLYCRIL